MKLIMIYGPPAVGKLTVAEALAKITGFKLLHNHLISDLAVSIFGRGNSASLNLNGQIRNLIYETAARNGFNGIISTFVYAAKPDINKWLLEHIETMRKHKSGFFFVKLSCDIEELRRRVVNPGRLGTKKITSLEILDQALQNEDSTVAIPKDICESLHIDNTNLEPEKVAMMIKSYCEL